MYSHTKPLLPVSTRVESLRTDLAELVFSKKRPTQIKLVTICNSFDAQDRHLEWVLTFKVFKEASYMNVT